MLPSFLGRDLLVQYSTTVVAVVFLILVWRNTHDLLKIAVEGGNILISDPQSNLRHGIIGGIEQFIGFLDAYHRQIFDWRHIEIFFELTAQLRLAQGTDGRKIFPGDWIHIVHPDVFNSGYDLLQSNRHGADMGFLLRIAAGDQEQQRCHKILFHGFMVLMLCLAFVQHHGNKPFQFYCIHLRKA